MFPQVARAKFLAILGTFDSLDKRPLAPAMSPTIRSGDTPNVGGHSDASSTPKRPLVPAPI